MLDFLIYISPVGTFLATVAGVLVGLPTMLAAFYQSWKARQEAKEIREGKLHSKNCLEFMTEDGNCVNLVPLETLHTLPHPGDIVLLPGRGINQDGEFIPGAYRVAGIEHIYAHEDCKGCRPQEARLTTVMARVTSLNPPLMVEG